jgi:hypothetical protein
LLAAAILVGILAAGQRVAKRGDASAHGKTRTDRHLELTPTSSVAGTITDMTGDPIARASVCAQTKDRESSCVLTGNDGTYVIGDLFPLAYEVTASARNMKPGRYHPDGNIDRERFLLAQGEKRAGVDIALEAGGVELTGTVFDVGGGPVVHARVRVAREDFNINEWRHWYPATETAADGSFTLWVAPGDQWLEASADGYGSVETTTAAPGNIDLLLTPAGTIAGTVVDRDNAPIADALVAADWVDEHKLARTDDSGQFEIEGLVPGRYEVSARTPNGYGTAVGSVLVGLAANVHGIIIRVDPAAHIVGRVLTAPPATLCPAADVHVTLHDPFGEDVEMSIAADGTLHADGVVAATYYAQVSCRGFFTPDHYPPIVVADRDQELTWRVTRGETLRGRVRASDGWPQPNVDVTVHDKTRYFSGVTHSDGSYEIGGMPRGDYDAWVTVDRIAMANVHISIADAVTVHDFVVDRPAKIEGAVVDTENRAVSGIEVRAEAHGKSGPLVMSHPDGTFSLNVDPGTYEVYAAVDWQHPLGYHQTVTASAGEAGYVRLVVPAQTGTISGDVVDAHGRPVGDAYVYAATPSVFDFDAFPIGLNEHPTLTRPDGTFTITGLGPGAYTVVTERRGGGTARVKDIAPGSKVSLVIPVSGSLSGRVSYTDHTHPQQMTVTVRTESDSNRFFREQRFYHTDGSFTLDELPSGTLEIAVSTADGLGVASLLLSPGEQRTDVAITVDRSVTVTGRLVDPFTRKGIAGFFIIPRTTRARLGTIVDYQDVTHQSDANGRFSVLAPPGESSIEITTADPRNRDYCAPARLVDLRAPTDIGDLPVLRPRVDPGGAVGFTLAAGKVDTVDPKGPAAAAGLRIGDVVTAVDGVGPASLVEDCGYAMISVAPGSVLSLTLARGETVKVTAGAVPPGSEIEIDPQP